MTINSDLARLSRHAVRALVLTAVPACLLVQSSVAQDAAKPASKASATATRDDVNKTYPLSDFDTRPYNKHDFNGIWARNPWPNSTSRPARNAAIIHGLPTATSAMSPDDRRGPKAVRGKPSHQGLRCREPASSGAFGYPGRLPTGGAVGIVQRSRGALRAAGIDATGDVLRRQPAYADRPDARDHHRKVRMVLG